MESLVGYGSDDENEERCAQGPHGGGAARREDDTNYDHVTMDMSEDSNDESDRELPPADDQRRRRDRRRSPSHSNGKERSLSPRRDRRHDDRPRDKHERSRDRERQYDKRPERSRNEGPSGSSSFIRADKDRNGDGKVPALMDLKPFGGDPSASGLGQSLRHDKESRERRSEKGDRREREREHGRERERDREHRDKDRQSRRSPDKRHKRRSRSRSRPRHVSRDRPAAPPLDQPAPFRGSEARAGPAPGEYRPSYKVSKKLQVMEKMGLQIKTPDGSMTTAQQLMQRSVQEQHSGPSAALPAYCQSKLVMQTQKRKLLWGAKAAEEAPAPAAAAWTASRFAQDTDGRVANKFMRLMGIKDPAAVKAVLPASAASDEVDVNRKQQEMFEAMQAQYDVARATTHTMRGVGLGFQRHL